MINVPVRHLLSRNSDKEDY